MKPLELEPFEDKNLRIVACLKEYMCIARTEKLREGRELFIPYVKPHKHASRDIISRWTKSVLEKADITNSQPTAHALLALLQLSSVMFNGHYLQVGKIV